MVDQEEQGCAATFLLCLALSKELVMEKEWKELVSSGRISPLRTSSLQERFGWAV